MGVACRKFDTPVTGGNVSFYNQSTNGHAVYPTPTIGMVGIIESEEHVLSLNFKNEGDAIVLIGSTKNDIGSSQYAAKLLGIEHSNCPDFDLDVEYNLHQFLGDLAGAKLVNSVHDISEGGLFVTCAESAMAGRKGFDICSDNSVRLDAWLYGESQSRVVLSLNTENLKTIQELAAKHHLPALHIGTVTANEVIVNGKSWGSLDSFKQTYK